MSAMTKRACGACSLCCKLPYVPELRKPIDTWCKHAAPGCGGCSIYPKRPRSCRDYICGWLFSEPEVGDEWFPAQCHMMLTPRRSECGSPLIPTIQMHGYVNHTTNRFGNGHNRNQSRSESAGDGFG